MRSPLRRALAGVALTAALTGGALVATGAPATAAPSKYYVNCSAKTNGDGSSAHPWNSVGAVHQHGAFGAGEQILLKHGTTCKGQLAPSGSGSKGHPIILGMWGKGTKPTIAGGGTSNGTGAVQLVNQSYWTVQDLHVTNKTSASTKTYRSGVLLQSNNGGHLSGLTVQRVSVDSVASNPGNGNTRMYGGISALTFSTTVKSGFSGLRILNNAVKSVSRTGIITSNTSYPKTSDTSTRIAGNHVSHVRGDGIVMIGATHGRIDHNAVSGAADLGECKGCGRIGGPSTASAGIWPSSARAILIEHNEVYGTHRDSGDGEAFDIDRSAVDVTLRYNYAHDNQGGAVMFCGANGATVRHNVFENNGRAVFTFNCKPASKNVSIYNNTVYQAKSVKKADWVVLTLAKGKGGKGIRFYNNVVYSYGPSGYRWPSKPYLAANTFIGRHGKTTPSGHGTSWRDPHLKKAGSGGTGFASVKGYRLKTTAGAQRGVKISKGASRDFFGAKVSTSKPIRGAASTR